MEKGDYIANGRGSCKRKQRKNEEGRRQRMRVMKKNGQVGRGRKGCWRLKGNDKKKRTGVLGMAGCWGV